MAGRQHTVELFFVDVENVFLAIVYIVPQRLTLVKGKFLDFGFKLGYGRGVGLGGRF